MKSYFVMASRINLVEIRKRFLPNHQSYEQISNRRVVFKEVGEVQDGPRPIYPSDYETQLPTAAWK